MSPWCEVCGFQLTRCTCHFPGGEGYMPIPVWERGWQPWNLATERPMQWPEWITAEMISKLPRPRYMLGEQVRFKWSFGLVPVGEVRRIWLGGGTVYKYALEDVDLLLRQRYSERKMIYTIYWHGHGRWINANDILGRS